MLAKLHMLLMCCVFNIQPVKVTSSKRLCTLVNHSRSCCCIRLLNVNVCMLSGDRYVDDGSQHQQQVKFKEFLSRLINKLSHVSTPCVSNSMLSSVALIVTPLSARQTNRKPHLCTFECTRIIDLR